MSEEFPVFDDEWVEQARHRELSVLELKRTQIMNPTQTVVKLGAGDRAGLARLGSGVCAGEL